MGQSAGWMYNNTKTAFIFTDGVSRIQKDFLISRGESQRPINQLVMKVSFPTGRRQKANCAGLRVCSTTLHPLPAPAGIFMSRKEETALPSEEENPSSIILLQHTDYSLQIVPVCSIDVKMCSTTNVAALIYLNHELTKINTINKNNCASCNLCIWEIMQIIPQQSGPHYIPL